MKRRRARGQRGRSRLSVADGHIDQRRHRVGWIHRIRQQHGVVHRAAQRDTLRRQRMKRQLPIVRLLGHLGVFQQSAKLGREFET